MITEEEFYGTYKPQINHFERTKFSKEIADEDVAPFSGAMYETYGQDEEYIQGMATDEATKKRVWTIIEGDDDKFYIVAGFHYVNRFGYIITEKEWETENEQVENDD